MLRTSSTRQTLAQNFPRKPAEDISSTDSMRLSWSSKDEPSSWHMLDFLTWNAFPSERNDLHRGVGLR